MSTLASDNFTRANQAPMAGNWTNLTSGTDVAWNLTANKAVPSNTGQDADAFWNALTWPADQWSQATVTCSGSGGGQGPGVVCRLAGATTKTMYRLVTSTAATNNFELSRFSGGVYTLVWDRTSAFASGGTLRLEVQGSTLRAYNGGTQIGANTTDSSIASGSAGLGFSSTDPSGGATAWSGGDFSAAFLAAPPLIIRQAVKRSSLF